jgi:hypothetical protein
MLKMGQIDGPCSYGGDRIIDDAPATKQGQGTHLICERCIFYRIIITVLFTDTSVPSNWTGRTFGPQW